MATLAIPFGAWRQSHGPGCLALIAAHAVLSHVVNPVSAVVAGASLVLAIRALFPLFREYVPERPLPGWRFLLGRAPQVVPAATYVVIVYSLSGKLENASRQ